MNRKGNIGILVLILCVSLMRAQSVIDTICVNNGPSHLAVPYQAGVSYQWNVSGGQIISKPDSNDVLVDWGSQLGIFQVSVSSISEHGCPGDTSVSSVYLSGKDRATAKGPTRVCPGTMVTFQSTATGDFMWSGGQVTPTISFIAERDTSVYLFVDNRICDNDTFFYFLDVIDAPISAMNDLPDTVQLHTSVNLYFMGGGATKVEWFYDGVRIATGGFALVQFNITGKHEIVQVVSGGECTDTLRKVIYVEDIFKVFIPNAFTPNGDGTNDIFKFDGVGIKSYTAQIYNRWGEMLFQWNESSGVEGWDGTQSGQESKIDAYLYKISVEDMNGQLHFFTNQFKLLR